MPFIFPGYVCTHVGDMTYLLQVQILLGLFPMNLSVGLKCFCDLECWDAIKLTVSQH